MTRSGGGRGVPAQGSTWGQEAGLSLANRHLYAPVSRREHEFDSRMRYWTAWLREFPITMRSDLPPMTGYVRRMRAPVVLS